jgi:N-acetyl-gamma-glutamyl-phosphate reductase
LKVGILNVTGYSGAELARILHRHPGVEIASITGRSSAGLKLGEVFPHLSAIDMTITEDVDDSIDFVFSALPHATSAERLAPLIRRGVRAVDISADFRLKDLDEYQRWYEVDHPCPEFLEDAVYGLTELHRDEIASAAVVANPGCYPTAAVLALAPAVQAGLIEPDIIVDAKSGVSGSGRGMSLTTHFSEVTENVMAYALDGHRHLPEIVQELERVNGADSLKVTFVPHLVPMVRGILASCYAPLKDGATSAQVRTVYEEAYRDETFARVVDAPPMTKHTVGNNDCVIFPTVDERSGRLVVVSCLDNLVKGAAGQAVQNMNLMCGFPEDEGLQQLALYP